MTLPDLQGCPRCHETIRKDCRRCPGCGLKLVALKIEMSFGGHPVIVERLIPDDSE